MSSLLSSLHDWHILAMQHRILVYLFLIIYFRLNSRFLSPHDRVLQNVDILVQLFEFLSVPKDTIGMWWIVSCFVLLPLVYKHHRKVLHVRHNCLVVLLEELNVVYKLQMLFEKYVALPECEKEKQQRLKKVSKHQRLTYV